MMTGVSINTFEYSVVSIDADYAYLHRTDIESTELKRVAYN